MATFKFDDIATDDDKAVDFNLAKNQLHYQIRWWYSYSFNFQITFAMIMQRIQVDIA